MAGIRVSWLPQTCKEKDIKIYFTKPENGGGHIQEIYYPLFHNDAVVIFEDPISVETVRAHRHTLKGEEIYVDPLPSPQVYTEMEAKLDPAVAAYLQATEEVRDELQYNRNVTFCMDRNNSIVSVRGNWYMLELVWAYIHQFTQLQDEEQKYQYGGTMRLQGQSAVRPPSPGEVQDPIISIPPVQDTGSSWSDRSPNAAKQVQDSAKAELKHNVLDTTKQDDSKESIGKTRRKTSAIDDEDDTIEKLADMKLGDEKTVTEITVLNDNPEDVRSLDFQYGPLTVSIYSGLITMAETDAIVNAAMGSMINAGGVAHAIASAAGPEMQSQCDEYVERHGSVPTTQVIHTCAGGRISLNVKYVIHAVGPVWSVIREGQCAAELVQTFLNCMTYANDHLKIKSITMPVISSGIFGCPLELCVRSFLNAVLLFSCERMSDATHLKEVNLVNNNNDNTAMTVIQLRELIPLGAKALVKEALAQKQQSEDIGMAKVPGQRLRLDDIGSTTLTNRTYNGVRGVQHASHISANPTASQTVIERHRVTITSPNTSMGSRNHPDMARPKAGIHTADKERLTANASSRNREGTGDISSKTRKSCPPTTSYAYEEYGKTGTKLGVVGTPKTTGRPLPPTPSVTSRQSKKY